MGDSVKNYLPIPGLGVEVIAGIQFLTKRKHLGSKWELDEG